MQASKVNGLLVVTAILHHVPEASSRIRMHQDDIGKMHEFEAKRVTKCCRAEDSGCIYAKCLGSYRQILSLKARQSTQDIPDRT